MKPVRFCVLGAGSWGAVMAAHLHRSGHPTTCWHFIEEEAHEFESTRRHPFLDGFEFPSGLHITSNLHEALDSGDIVVLAVPSQVVRSVMQRTAPLIAERPVMNLSKGIEQGTLLRMSEVILATSEVPPERIATVYGPSHAEEVMQQLPTTLVAASENLDYAQRLQQLLSTQRLRVYTNRDIIGVELGGSVKNVIAIAAGICVGVGYGDNTLAALVTRGLAEITRLGLALGAERHTFAGLAGIGDLVVTAYSRHSRNRYLGVEIGKGRKVKDVLDGMAMVAEGLYTSQSVMGLAEKYQVDLPICQEVYRVLFEDKDPRQAITDLMTRDLRDETTT
jgi:glycerol-3-phosphate dehydrogenase (NAD(P)+)